MNPRPHLFGRTGELELMGGLVARVRSGQSAVVVLRGEPGIGKTALLSHLIEGATEFTVARVLGVESEMELPFAGLHELCGPLLGRLGCLPEPQHDALSVAFGLAAGRSPDRFMVALGALSLLSDAADVAPMLCVVDDAQWLDQASAQVFGFIGRRLEAEQIALVLAAREPLSPDPLAGLPELRVGGLDEVPARALLATVVPGPLDEKVRDRIVEETHGNPLALLELCRGLTAGELAGGFALPDAGDVPKRIEEQYRERFLELPDEAQLLILLAASDPVGDSAVLLRAAEQLGLGPKSVRLAGDSGLLDIGANVRFRHPLVRSAVYRAAADADRRAAHQALAEATDPDTDPDRRAWHRAHAAAEPEEAVAQELIESADRARARGGMAAAAAFLAQAVPLTPDSAERAARAMAAAEAKYAAGDINAVRSLLVTAEVGPPDKLRDALVQRMRAQVAFALRRGSDAPAMLFRAAQRLETLDPEMARRTYLEALVAVIYAGRLVRRDDVVLIARAAADVAQPPDHSGLLLHGLAVRCTEGYEAAAPVLREALRRYRSLPKQLDWQCVAFNIVAMDLWDGGAWSDLAAGQVELARGSGTISWLLFAVDHLAELDIHSGQMAHAEALVAEGERIDPGVRAAALPYVPILLAAWRGDGPAVTELSEVMDSGAWSRGEGRAFTYAEYAKAVLHNGLGAYLEAAEAADLASAADEVAVSPWALSELVEAAARSDQRDRAAAAAARLSRIAEASGTDWAHGAAARSVALISEGREAENAYARAVELLGCTRMAVHLARTRLVYGEWLRRENRRVDARDQLRPAFEVLSASGAQGFADRARRELLATGEKVRKRDDSTRDELTSQEEEIAQLASQGRTNPEIGAQLFIGARTVEWHLRKVFAKLGVSSRRELDEALKRRPR